jgi:hypothetical protein
MNSRRIIELSNLVSKYSHCWNENPSIRMMTWVDDLNDLISLAKTQHTTQWKALCDQQGWAYDINAYDSLA